MDPIISRTNPKIKQARRLRQRKARQASGLFLVEGIRPVGEAVEAGAPVESLFYAPELLTSAYAQGLINQLIAQEIPCYPTSPEVFATLAEKENPQGLLAMVRMRPASLEGLTPGNFPWGVALVTPQDPGNIGAILRTVDAVGASGLLLLEGGADPYHPQAVRASMGALFWHPVVQASFAEFTAWAKRGGYAVIGTSAHAEKDYREAASTPPPLILLLGSEQKGLSAEQMAICTEVVRIPMKGRVTSLNLAAAAAVMMYGIEGKD
jgi:TrmH family RNA methyltransferase